MIETHGVRNEDCSLGVAVSPEERHVLLQTSHSDLLLSPEEARYIAAWLNDFAGKVENDG